MTLAIPIGDPEASFRAARELGQLGAASAEENVATARRALAARDFERAAALAALGSARAPDSADAALVVGMARFRAHQPAEAIAPFTRAVTLAPSSATLRFNLAAALYQSGRFVEAENRYLEAAARDDKIAPLSLYHAALAAPGTGHPPRPAPPPPAAAEPPPG